MKRRSIARCRLVEMVGVLVTALVPLSVASAGTPIPFTDEAVTRGIDYPVGSTSAQYGCGVAFVDLDGDGDPDVITLGQLDGVVGVYENNGLGYFIDRTLTGGLARFPYASGITAADYDDDGDLDVFLSNSLATNALLRNDGNFQFTDVTTAAGLDDLGAGTGCAWADFNGDGWLDLYVSNRTFSWTSLIPNRMYLNLGDGTFQEVGETWGVNRSDDPTFLVTFLDYDRDGDADLYLGNDHGTGPILQNHLFENIGNTTFVDVTTATGTAADVDCMGTAVGDWTRNGWQDIYVTNIPQGNVLMLNQTNGTFADQTVTAGVGSYVVGWGTHFFDYDNDGWLELYVGNMDAPNRLYDYDGTWPAVDIGSSIGLADPGTTFCLASADIDNDGDIDLLVATVSQNMQLYINNEGQLRRWVKFNVVGKGRNRFAIGAQVDVRTGGVWQMAEIHAGSNYKSQNDLTLHFGMDTTTMIDEIRILWPGGETRTLSSLSTNQTWKLYPAERLGDGDGDGDVDLADFALLTDCVTGPTPGSLQPGCEMMDMDGDGDVDLQDFAGFTGAFN